MTTVSSPSSFLLSSMSKSTVESQALLNGSTAPNMDTNLFDAGEEIDDSPATPTQSVRLIQKFSQQRLRMDLSIIEDPELTSRDVDMGHVENVLRGISTNGFQEALGLISVTAKRNENNANASGIEISNGEITSPAMIVDGRHRRFVLLQLIAKGDAQELKELVSKLPVFLWSRKDGKALSSLDILGLSAFLNDQSSNVRKPDFKDRVHASISTVKAIRKKASAEDRDNLSLEHFAAEIMRTGSLGTIERGCAYRFAQIGLRFADDRMSAERFTSSIQSCPKLNLTHVSSNKLLELDGEGFQLGIDSVCRRFQLPLHGAFRSLRKPFFTCLNKMYTLLKAAARKANVPIATLLDEKVSCGAHEEISIRESVHQQLLRFNLVQQQDMSDYRRLLTLHGRLVTIVPDLPSPTNLNGPKPSSTPSSAKKTKRKRITRKRTGQQRKKQRRTEATKTVGTMETEDSEFHNLNALDVLPQLSSQRRHETQHARDLPVELSPQRAGRRANDVNHGVGETNTSIKTNRISEPDQETEAPVQANEHPKNSGSTGDAFGMERISSSIGSGASEAVHSILNHCLDQATSKIYTPCEPAVPVCDVHNPETVHSDRKNSEENGVQQALPNSADTRNDSVPVSHSLQLERDTGIECTKVNRLRLRIRLKPKTVVLSASRPRYSNPSDLDRLRESLESLTYQELKGLMGEVGFQILPKHDDLHNHWENDSSLIQRSFNDETPPELPLHLKDPSPYTGCQDPSWCHFATEIPSSWPTSNPIEHIAPWLQNMFIPAEHRANVTITDAEFLRYNHHFVYWRASFNMMESECSESLNLGESRVHSPKISRHMKRWTGAIEKDVRSLFYFGMKRYELQEKGFCILEGFLDDAEVPDELDNITIKGFASEKNFLKHLEADILDSFPRDLGSDRAVNHLGWNRNTADVEPEESDVGKSRKSFYISSTHGITEAIERDPNRVWACRNRSWLDARVCQSFLAMGIWNNVSQSKGNMFIPRTGGRWLITTSGCVREPLHSDFSALSRKDTLMDTGNPGYFSICTGEQETTIWICPRSHKLLAAISAEQIQALSYATTAYLQKVPPYSIFFGRGDIIHSEPGFSDFGSMNHGLRYRMHFVPENTTYSTRYNVLDMFQPFPCMSLEYDSEGEYSSAMTHNETSRFPAFLDQSDNTINQISSSQRPENIQKPESAHRENTAEQPETATNVIDLDPTDQNITFS